MSEFQLAQVVESPTELRGMVDNLEAAQLGLERFKVLGRKGDLTVILTQKKFEHSGRTEPAMVLANSRSPRERHVFIALSQLYQLIHPRIMSQNAPVLCKQLYGFITRDDLFRVSDAIYEYAEDLKNAPPPRRLGSREWLAALARDGWTFARNGQALNG